MAVAPCLTCVLCDSLGTLVSVCPEDVGAAGKVPVVSVHFLAFPAGALLCVSQFCLESDLPGRFPQTSVPCY